MTNDCCCSLLGCHIALSNMASGNQWGQLIQLVMWCCLKVLAVAVEHVGGWRWVAAIGDGGW